MSDSILTVVMPAPDRRLAAVADVRSWLLPSDTASDNDLNALIGRVSDLIAGGCNGRVFGREALREVFRPDGPVKPLILARFPVAAVSSVVAGGVTLSEGVDFEVDAASGLVHRLSGDARCAWRAAKIIVEYTAGWLLPSQDGSDLPGDVRQVCINRVVRMRAGQGRDPNIRSESTEGVDSISFFDPDKLSTQEMIDLRLYVIRRL